MGQIIEYLVITFVILGVLFGFVNGFIRVFFSWFSVLVGAIIAMNFSYGFTKSFFPNYANNIILIFFIGIVLFSIVYLVITQIAHLCSNAFQTKNMGGLENLLGGFFGGIQVMIVVGLAIYWIMALNIVDMSQYPISMFSAYWAEKFVLLVGTQVGVANHLLK